MLFVPLVKVMFPNQNVFTCFFSFWCVEGDIPRLCIAYACLCFVFLFGFFCVFSWICVLRMVSWGIIWDLFVLNFCFLCFLIGVLRVISLDNVWQAGGGDKQTNSCTCPIPHLRSAGQLQVLTISGLFLLFLPANNKKRSFVSASMLVNYKNNLCCT